MKGYIGDTSGTLTVIENLGKRFSGNRNRLFLKCECECGAIVERVRDNFYKAKHCGAGFHNRKKDSHVHHKKYHVWTGMRARCYQPGNPSYKDYGGRGIIICEEWRDSPIAFLNWYDSNCGGNYKLQVDRIDVNGPYSLENCRLSTCKAQQANKTNNTKIQAFGDSGSLITMVERYGKAPYGAVKSRLHRGWSPERALSTSLGFRDQKDVNKSLYNRLLGIIHKCSDPKDGRYPWYGGRGIYVCDEWSSLNKFQVFKEWSLSNGWSPGLQLDRIDNDGPYSPENCRFVTGKENMNNRRCTKLYSYKGVTSYLEDLTKRFSDLPFSTVLSRVSYGWDIEDALEVPQKF